MPDELTIEVITTVRIGTTTKTFTVNGTTTGNPHRAARDMVSSAAGDARDWAYDLEDGRVVP